MKLLKSKENLDMIMTLMWHEMNMAYKINCTTLEFNLFFSVVFLLIITLFALTIVSRETGISEFSWSTVRLKICQIFILNHVTDIGHVYTSDSTTSVYISEMNLYFWRR